MGWRLHYHDSPVRIGRRWRLHGLESYLADFFSDVATWESWGFDLHREGELSFQGPILRGAGGLRRGGKYVQYHSQGENGNRKSRRS